MAATSFEIYAAFRFFQLSARESFFALVQRNSSNALKALKSMVGTAPIGEQQSSFSRLNLVDAKGHRPRYLTSFHSIAVSSRFLRAFSLEGLFTTWNTVGLNCFPEAAT
jgi:hypothetical protein